MPHYVASVQAARRPASKLSSRVLLASRSRKGALRTTQTLRASLQDVGMLLAAAADEAVEAVKPGSVEAPTGRTAHSASPFILCSSQGSNIDCIRCGIILPNI